MVYQLDGDVMTGYVEIDRYHQDIADLSGHLKEALEQHAAFEDVREIFGRLREALLEHFDVEERAIARLPQNTEVRAHLRRHKDNHDRFRDLLIYASEQFELARATATMPSVAAMIPQEYFEELNDVDSEMKTMLKKYGTS